MYACHLYIGASPHIFVAASGHNMQADLPTCSPLHSCISATCMCGHAAFTHMCMHVTFVYTLYFAGEQVVFRDVSCIPMCWGISEGMCTPYVCI